MNASGPKYIRDCELLLIVGAAAEHDATRLRRVRSRREKSRQPAHLGAGNLVAETIELAREKATVIRRKPAGVIDNTFVEQLEMSGFMKEQWGGVVPDDKKRL